MLQVAVHSMEKVISFSGYAEIGKDNINIK